MSAAIGLQALSLGTSITSSALNISDALKEGSRQLTQLTAKKEADTLLMKRRITEVAIGAAGAQATVAAHFGGVVEGRSLDIAASNIAGNAARQVADIAFVGENQRATTQRQIEATQRGMKRAFVNGVMEMASSALSFGGQAAQSGAAMRAISENSAAAFTGIETVDTSFTPIQTDLLLPTQGIEVQETFRG